MTDLVAVLEQLKEERAKLDRAIAALSGVVGAKSSSGKRGKRTLSVAARKRIAAAQRARWAKVRAKKAA
jgi:ABC-type transporter Mla subunit MlaD